MNMNRNYEIVIQYEQNIIKMQFPPQNVQVVHNYGLTVAWSGLYNIMVILAIFKYSKVAALIHLVLGFIILFLTYFSCLYLLIPYGFNITAQAPGQFYAHGILGLSMLGFSVVQVGGGLFTRIFSVDRRANLKLAKVMKITHLVFGYLLGIIYKINILWIWYYIPQATYIILAWEILSIIVLLYFKISSKKLQQVILDSQTISTSYLQIESTEDIKSITTEFVIFANHVYKVDDLKNIHPGGTKVIDIIMNREVDRFLYGMYSAEIFPQLSAYSHSSNSLKMVGKPIAKINIQNPYTGYTGSIEEVKIKLVEVVSEKTQIYLLGLQPRNSEFVFSGYTSLRQLGQYYSLTIDNKITRLYTTVNFLNKENENLILKLLNLTKNDIQLKKISNNPDRNMELMTVNDKKENLISNKAETNNYLPIMLKVYDNGKFTSQLKKKGFSADINLKISQPLGRGLELSETPTGRIIIVAGGTGIFPFSDLIDLIYKERLISLKHELSEVILRNNPILHSRPFEKYSFVVLLAINQPDDIHPITLHQLAKISHLQDNIQIVMRVKKNQKQIESLQSKIQLTTEYFTKRLLSEASVKGLSKIWICGPPKMNEDTAKSLLQNGFTSSNYLMI